MQKKSKISRNRNFEIYWNNFYQINKIFRATLSLLKIITNLFTMRESLFRYLATIASIKLIKIKRIVANFKNYLYIVAITEICLEIQEILN